MKISPKIQMISLKIESWKNLQPMLFHKFLHCRKSLHSTVKNPHVITFTWNSLKILMFPFKNENALTLLSATEQRTVKVRFHGNKRAMPTLSVSLLRLFHYGVGFITGLVVLTRAIVLASRVMKNLRGPITISLRQVGKAAWQQDCRRLDSNISLRTFLVNCWFKVSLISHHVEQTSQFQLTFKKN